MDKQIFYFFVAMLLVQGCSIIKESPVDENSGSRSHNREISNILDDKTKRIIDELFERAEDEENSSCQKLCELLKKELVRNRQVLFKYLQDRYKNCKAHKCFKEIFDTYIRLQVLFEKRRILKGHTEPVVAIAFSMDGKFLASASWDGTVGVWDVRTGKQLHRLRVGRMKEVESVAFSPDGKMLAAGTDDGHIYIWSPDTGVLLQTLAGAVKPNILVVNSLVFSPDGEILASTENKIIRIWDLKTGRCLRVLKCKDVVVSVDFSPDGKLLASIDSCAPARLWDPYSGICLQLLEENFERCEWHGNYGDSIAFSPDGSLLAYARLTDVMVLKSGKLGVRTNERLVLKEPYAGCQCSVTFSPDSCLLAAADKQRGVIRIWNPRTGECLRTLEGQVDPTDSIESVRFSPDGKFLACGNWSGNIVIWSIPEGDAEVEPKGEEGLEQESPQ